MPLPKFSIPKNGDGAGCATPKDPTIIVIDVDDVQSEPTRVVGNTVVEGELTLTQGGKAMGIYATPDTIDAGYDPEGETDAKGFKQKVGFDHPGDSVEINNFAEGGANKGFILLVKECDGSASGTTKIYGSKCNPLFMTSSPTNNKDGNKRHFDFAQSQVSKFVPGFYNGELPALAEASKVNTETE